MLPSVPMTREVIRIDNDLQIEEDGINAAIETWFDVDEKFSVNTRDDDSKWLNLYATYNPDKDTLRCFYFVESDTDCQEGAYTPLPEEITLIKEMMNEMCLKEHGCDLHGLWGDRGDESEDSDK